jgi:hypothetical protein
MEGALDDAREIARVLDPIDSLTERAVDLVLIRVLVQVHFLVRMPSMEVRLDVPGNGHHRDRIERGVRNPGGSVGQARAKMREKYSGLTGRSRVAVGRVRGDLLVPRADVADPAVSERVEHRDDRMPGQAEDDLDAEALEVVGQQIRREPRLARRRQRFGNDVDGCAHRVVP